MSTELKTISSRAIIKLKMEEKQPRLTRSSSLDKIKKFNTFICAQQYYILPSLLSWLKNSQSSLQTSTESTIYFLRAFILNVFFKFYLALVRSVQICSIEKIQNIKSKLFDPTLLLRLAVYSACLVVLLQFVFSIYLIYLIFLPHGFIFLIGCMLTIKLISYKTMFNCLTKKRSDKKFN